MGLGFKSANKNIYPSTHLEGIDCRGQSQRIIQHESNDGHGEQDPFCKITHPVAAWVDVSRGLDVNNHDERSNDEADKKLHEQDMYVWLMLDILMEQSVGDTSLISGIHRAPTWISG